MRLFAVLLCSFVPAVAAWAGCHRDLDKDHRSREICKELGFASVPAGFEPTTQVMLFPKNQFSSLSWSSFQIFPRIYELDFTSNKILELTPSVTPVLPTLSVLRLGSNLLKSLPDGSFSACPALTELYLDNNTIDSLSDHTFSGLSRLEILDLSSNRIKVLPELMLHPLRAIETLNLEYNQIMVIPDDWFSQKEEVPYLFLSANPWACYCSLNYFYKYVYEFEINFYIWKVDGESNIASGIDSVICASPPELKNQPVISLENSDLCPPATELDPTEHQPDTTTTTPDTTPNPTTTTTPTPNPTTPTTTTPNPTTTTTTTPNPTTNTTTTPNPTTTTTTTTTPPTTTTPTLTMTPKHWVVTITAATLSTATLSTATLPTATLPTATLTPSLVAGGRVRGSAAFCFWLFAGGLLLCALTAVCIVATLVKSIVWYRRVYRPLCATLARRRGGGEAVRLLTYNSEVAGGGGVMALYRSVLFVHREGGEAMERGGEGGEGRRLVILEPTGGRGGAAREEGGERPGREEKGVYRKTLYRLSSKEEEVEGWRDVVEECRVSAEEGGRRRGEETSGGVSRKRYSIILREEREEAGGGREELDWVVGGWEVKRGGGGEGEVPRSSWGEWLAHYLPSMPWGVTTPPESDAAL